jgi:uncharacterized membrane protein
MTDISSTRPAYIRTEDRPAARYAPLTPWLLIGIGLGGLIDGIVFHEILQWHNLLSNAVPPTDADRLRFNVLADGLFHAGAWLVTALGLLLLWRSVRSGRSNTTTPGAFGALLGGLGLFNLTEGIINHHLLELHNVREVADPTEWNLGFLVVAGIVPLVLGALLRQRAMYPRTRDVVARNPVRMQEPTLRAEAEGPATPGVHLVQLLLPLFTRGGQPIDPRAFDNVKNELTTRFGGMTAYTRSPAEGRWLGRAHRETDDIAVLEVLCNEIDPVWWDAYRHRLEGIFGQHAIAVRAAPVRLL